jgi:hypothetical protein
VFGTLVNAMTNLSKTLARFKAEGQTSTSDILKAYRKDQMEMLPDLREEFDDELSDDDVELDGQDSGLLPLGCCLCGAPLHESEAVHTAKGMAHEECAEKRWPFDPHRDLGIPRGEL